MSDAVRVALLCGSIVVGVLIGSYIGSLINGARFK